MCDQKTIVTNAHGVLHKSGKALWEFQHSGCIFITLDHKGNEIDEFEVDLPTSDETFDHIGSRYPNTSGQRGRDWAILKLKKLVPTTFASTHRIGFIENIYSLQGKGMLILSPAGDTEHSDPFYRACSASYVKTDRKSNPYAHSACQSAPGSSGSPILTRKENEKLVIGVHAYRFSSMSNRQPKLGYKVPDGADAGSIIFGPNFVASMKKLGAPEACFTLVE